ncbi:MAG: penicillin-binding transpeptidase domain-containing protein [Clostridiaceae bacterium]|nr:penicillin-binding transpeptidase domain-containing protein [Clostridiaceae bacterium]
MNLKKLIILLGTVFLLICSITLVGCEKSVKPSETFDLYKNFWQKQDFKGMYTLLSTEAKGKITEDNFVKRYKDIYSGIEAANIKINAGDVNSIKKDSDKNVTVPFSVVMDTLAGNTEIKAYNMNLKEEKIESKNKWTVVWDEKLIFPTLGAKDKVKANPLFPIRGEITDRNGTALATNGPIKTIGIFPSKFDAVKATAIPEMSKMLDIAQDRISNLLKSSSNPEWFVPIVNLSVNDKEKITKLTGIPGVQYKDSQGRVYPGGEAFGSLIGYVGEINADELDKLKNEGYSAHDKIGKAGLEQVYDKRLKGEKGGEILILKDGKETSKEVIAKKEAKNGESIKLSIDLVTQRKIYIEMKGDAGAATAINPKTGEILALVSSPSFDSNLYSTYIPDSINNAWKIAVKSPLINRFKAVYTPGSTFKLITGAIGLKTGIIKPEETLDIIGKDWKSAGNVKVTRVDDLRRPVNLLDAYITSDNIYFARQALKIGKDNFINEVKNFGIGEPLPIDYPIGKSQLINSNSDLSREQLLADTGFGQGEIQLSTLNLAMIYSALANTGDIMTPVLELKDDITPKVWKEKAIAADNVKILSDALIQVVENPEGTGYGVPKSNIKILGKTGTAELKKDAKDIKAEENGWFVAMNVEDPRLVVAMLVEDVKNRGESKHVVKIVKKVFEDSFK